MPTNKTMAEELAFQCPCGVETAVVRSTDGSPGLVHPLPMCALFEQTDDPADYLQACRLFREAKSSIS